MVNEEDQMEDEENNEQFDASDEREFVIDSYTGELVPAVEDADKFEEVIPVDSGNRSGDEYLLEEETSMDYLAADENAEPIMEEDDTFLEEDEDLVNLFEDRQNLGVSGRKELKEDLKEHNSKSPILSGGDLDADWESADVGGEETVGGSTPTPDQDVVDEIGQALGITYADDEPLNTEEKLRKRDQNRWELDPASAQDEDLEE